MAAVTRGRGSRLHGRGNPWTGSRRAGPRGTTSVGRHGRSDGATRTTTRLAKVCGPPSGGNAGGPRMHAAAWRTGELEPERAPSGERSGGPAQRSGFGGDAAKGRPGASRWKPVPWAWKGWPQGRCENVTTGSWERQPQGREWLKHTTGHGEAQAVKVVGNGGGGTKQEWNPATGRHRRRDESHGRRVVGKWILHAGSAGGVDKPMGEMSGRKAERIAAKPGSRTAKRTRSSRVSESS